MEYQREDDDDDSSYMSGGDAEEDSVEGVHATSASPTNAIREPVDPTMELSATERQWALEVKRAVLEDEELMALTDFEYAQHAIVAEGNLPEALFRIGRMQDFRQHYKVEQTVEQGLELLLGLMQQQPGFLLHVDVSQDHDSINVIDIGMFDPNVALATDANGKENWRTFICGVYYMKYCAQPAFANIRNGFFALADFGDLNNFNFKPEAQQRLFDEILRSYPYKWKHFLAYNTGYVANIKMGLAKALMSKKMRNVVQLGCHIEESEESRNPTQRLRDFYLLPNLEEAYKSLLVKAHALLERRTHNERTFRL